MHEFMYTGLIAMLIVAVDKAWESRGVLTLYLLSLAGVLFDSRGIGMCESVCTEPIVVQHVMLRGRGAEVQFG